MKYIENILKRKRNLIRKESKNRNRIKSRNAPKRPPKLVSRRSHKLPQACFQIDPDWIDFPTNQKSGIFLKGRFTRNRYRFYVLFERRVRFRKF